MIEKCLICKKRYVTKHCPSYLCKKCKKEAKKLPEGDKSKLKLISECEDLGIIYFDVD